MKVYVVYWSGDEDCSGRNDGPISVHSSLPAARGAARGSAYTEARKRDDRYAGYPGDWEKIVLDEEFEESENEPFRISLYGERCSCLVRVLEVNE